MSWCGWPLNSPCSQPLVLGMLIVALTVHDAVV
jgi:hypothetical protein